MFIFCSKELRWSRKSRMKNEIREMIIEEATAALREILPRMVREIAQKHFEEHRRDQEALRFDKGNDYY